ncbi:MAG: sensor histidine kinase [Planctomycetota bacterium]
MIDRPPHLRAHADACLIEEVRASLRHSLRNRLGAVRNATFYIRRKVDGTPLPASDARIPKFFDMVDSEVTEATKLLDSRIAPDPAPAATPLRATVEHLIAETRVTSPSIAVARGAEVDANIDRLDLELAFFCLLENAAQAASSAVSVEVSRDGDNALVTVSDDGPGFAPGARERAFEIFFTTRPGRAGLGLNVAKRIAERWSGSVSVEEKPGGGARATLRVPVAAGGRAP